MTKAQKFLKLFPKAQRNTNCLENVACPKCGNRELFVIDALVAVKVVDDGTEDCMGDYEWDPSSYCRCEKCDLTGKLRDFTHRGLDDLIAARNETETTTTDAAKG